VGRSSLPPPSPFLPFNFPKAQVFLGDVGSYFIGAWLAALVILGLRAGIPPEAVLAPVALYLADTAVTIVRRARGAETWYLPRRSHAYQRLTQLGWSHTRTTGLVAAAMVSCSALGAVSLIDSIAARLVADLALAAVLVAYLASPTLLGRGQTASSPTNA
jgi:UDP-N-acetylmuramyl pentapeptide phosphotransferase/UDP-N-acetylglucosamine-1-phosphate transferase